MPVPAPSSPVLPPALGEPYLLTPGPLTTAPEVKQAMLRDWGSWDDDFRALTARLRRELLALIDDREDEFTCVPLQGSGSYCVEAMLGTLLPREAKVLVLANGAYGQRAAQILAIQGRAHVVLDKGDYLPPRADEVATALAADPEITHVFVVQCETSSGILNPVAEISRTTYAAGRRLLVDSVSAFGALPAGLSDFRYEAMACSANKCIEGVPGFGFVFARKSDLREARGRSPSLALDLAAQWETLEASGQWRFTPPTHVVAAFLAALEMHTAEGGIGGRLARYSENRDVLVAGMRAAGFETLLPDSWLSPIIVTFFCPADPAFSFARFYQLMKAKGFIIYPGKLTEMDSFRLGCIGRLDAAVMRRVVQAAREALAEMGVTRAAPSTEALAHRTRLAG